MDDRFDCYFNPGMGQVNRLQLDLPIPVSANKMNSLGRKGLFRSLAYKSWIAESHLYIKNKRQQLGYVIPPVSIQVIVRGGSGWPEGSRDIDNILKPTIDLLKSIRVLDDDTTRYVRHVSAQYEIPIKQKEYASCQVIVRSLMKPIISQGTLKSRYQLLRQLATNLVRKKR